jgi:3-hydroxyacyl-CoA dehydrogenase/enoyl-CoA hydratase/3-hydroxybutyryl-CoA epimerase
MAFFQTDNLWVNQLADGVAALVLDVADHRVNVFTREVLADLEAALDRVAAEPSFRLLLIRSGKDGTFLAGADLHEFASLQGTGEAIALSERGQKLFDKLATLRLPTVAVISGACVGGGLEFALACDYRVVLDQPKTQLGLPEIELGLIPGWGGTQRLPRLVGLERALQIILGGRRLSAQESVDWGLADELGDVNQPEPPHLLHEAVKRPRTSLPLRTWRQWLLEGTPLGRWLIFRGARRLLQRRLADDMPAPWEALRAVQVGLKQGMEVGLAYEREAIGRVVTSSACRNLVRLFLQREQAGKTAAAPEEGVRPVRNIGVIGLGTMGAGIAQLAALKGCNVIIRETDKTALGQGILRILGLFQQAVQRGLLPAGELERRLGAIHYAKDWKEFAELDLVIEAVTEDLEVKRKVFREVEDRIRIATLLVTNTSSLTVGQLQEGLKHPERVAGLHFFNPVHKMPLVEVVQTSATKPQTLATLRHWAGTLGKTPVLVKDSPGFLVNRILTPYLNEAATLVGEGMRIALIDEAMRRFGMLVGPLELLDQIGLDVAAHVAATLQPVFAGRGEPSPVFERMTEKSWLGQKSGLGFYRYQRRRPRVHQAAQEVLRGLSGQQVEMATPAELMATARERMVCLSVNEAALCLSEGLAENAAAIDLAMVLGSSWAPHRGGPLRYADERGLSELVRVLADLASRRGPRFEPCPELRRRAEAGEPFHPRE